MFVEYFRYVRCWVLYNKVINGTTLGGRHHCFSFLNWGSEATRLVKAHISSKKRSQFSSPDCRVNYDWILSEVLTLFAFFMVTAPSLRPFLLMVSIFYALLVFLLLFCPLIILLSRSSFLIS